MSAERPASADPNKRLRATNTLLAIVILLLLGQVAWQEVRISGLKNDLSHTQRTLDLGIERMAAERLKTLRREDIVAAVQWLDDFYRSADGLRRPTGLWRADLNRPDGEAIGVWILDVYLQARIAGKSDAEARQGVIDQVKGTDEWRQKHPKG
jgi:hypothetical protein